LTFGASEPHLVPFYSDRLQRPYADRNINSEESGYLVPNVSFPCGVDRARGIGLHQPEGSDDFPPCVERVLAGTGAVRCASCTEPREYSATLHEALAELPDDTVAPLRGLSDDETDACTARSVMIRCAAGDHVVVQDGTARNMYVVLDGALEVHRDGIVLPPLGPGDVFGERGGLLGGVRSADVLVTAEGTRVLSLSERTLRSLVTDHPIAAAKFWRNIATILCARLSDGGLVSG
jgi:hypothetical protein